MKNSAIFFLTVALCFNFLNFSSSALEEPRITGEYAILIDAGSGQVLYEKNADTPWYPASTTKILTALIILENHTLDEIVTIDAESPFAEGSKIFIYEGEQLSIRELLYAMMVSSANDIAEALAVYHSGNPALFSEEMNLRAKELGAVNSNFMNPHGLHHDSHMSTPRDMAIIAMKAYENPAFQDMVRTVTYTIEPNEFQPLGRVMKTTNKFLYDTARIPYQGESVPIRWDLVDGIKTGYTTVSKGNLVTTAQKNGIRLISVVFNSDSASIYSDSRSLLEFGFDSFKYHSFTFSGNKILSLPVENGTQSQLSLFAADTVTGLIEDDVDINEVVEELKLEEITLPIEKDQVLGSIVYRYGDRVLGRTDLVSDADIEEETLPLTLKNLLVRRNGLGEIEFRYYWDIFLKFLLAFLIWRTVITLWRLQKIRKKTKRKKGVHVQP
ncbi:MAG: hypothetical protein AVO33_00015 [delta proteobacterium ML8_F1]|nr:MAG: hypothetical protein AVO33_00015 [delta proteobacterium ML8_F1]